MLFNLYSSVLPTTILAHRSKNSCFPSFRYGRTSIERAHTDFGGRTTIHFLPIELNPFESSGLDPLRRYAGILNSSIVNTPGLDQRLDVGVEVVAPSGILLARRRAGKVSRRPGDRT